jgi:hypothetical protein
MRLRQTISIICLFLAVQMLSGCVAKNVVKKVSNLPPGAKTNIKGVYYALPRTVVSVSVPIKKTIKLPGEFRQFAHCFFPGIDPVEDVIQEEKHIFSLGTPVFAIRGEPDATKVFMVKINGGFFEDKTLQMDLTEGGVMTKAEATTENKALEFASKAFKTFVAIGTQAVGRGPASEGEKRKSSPAENDCEERYTMDLKNLLNSLPRPFQEYEKLAKAKKDAAINRDQAKMFRDAEQTQKDELVATGAASADQIKQANDDLKEKESLLKKAEEEFQKADQDFTQNANLIKSNYQAEEKRVALTRKTLDDFRRAQQAYQKLIELQGKKEQLISSAEIQIPQETFTLMIKKLDELIDFHKSQFFGATVKEDPWTATFEIKPEETAVQITQELFRIAATGSKESNGGICQLDPKYQYLQVPSEFKNVAGKPCQDIKTVTLKLYKSGSDNIASQIPSVDFSKNEDHGFFYRIPGKALVTLDVTDDKGTTEKGRDTLAIAQFGALVALPASTGGRKTQYSLNLFDSSGALKQITVGSSALIQNSLLDDIQAAATNINDLRAAKAKEKAEAAVAAATAADELTQLQRQAAILELKAKIKELEEKLKQPTP